MDIPADQPPPAGTPNGQPITSRSPKEARAAKARAQDALQQGLITARQFDDITEAADREIDPLHAALK